MKKTVSVCDYIIAAEDLGSFFYQTRKTSVKAAKTWTTNVMKRLLKSFGYWANIGSAGASAKFEATLSTTPVFVSFNQTAKDFLYWQFRLDNSYI